MSEEESNQLTNRWSLAWIIHDHGKGRGFWEGHDLCETGNPKPYTCSLVSPSVTLTSCFFLPRKIVTFTVSPAR